MHNITDITTSIGIPQLIKDNFISKGKPDLDNRERPIHYSGGYAVVFPFIVDGQKWAFRCWWSTPTLDWQQHVEHRLMKISSLFKKVNLPYFCDFTYESEGLIVEGQVYPTTRMRWIDGLNLKDYICKECHNTGTMDKLASDFVKMCNSLHENHIAHGDLQHGNILLDKDGNIFLIDYDSMFIPGFEEESDIITGLPDYQHPNRRNNKMATYKLDYFSELIIYLSILAIKEKPSFIADYQIEDADRLLFKKDDFSNFKSSKIYTDLQSLSPKIKELTDILQQYLELNDINEFGPFLIYERLHQYKLNYGDIQYCTYCGTKYRCTEDNNFCINCGKLITYGCEKMPQM